MQTFKKWNKIIKVWKPFLECFAFIVAGFVAWVNFNQWHEMIEVRNLDERAWIVAQEPNVSAIEDGFIRFNIPYKNTGKTPAINTQIQAISKPFISDVPIEDVPPFPRVSSGLTSPNGTGFSYIKLPVESIQTMGSFYIYGSIWYDDIFGRGHWSQFCFSVKCDKKKNIEIGPASVHNSCDDAHKEQSFLTMTNHFPQLIIKNVIGSDSSWFWTMVQGVAVTFTLILIYRQLNAQRYGNILNSFSILNDRWNSKEMRNARKILCAKYGSNNLSLSEQDGLVIDFFEEMGLYLKKRVYTRDIVWELYSYYIEHYWCIANPLISEYRLSAGDNTLYSSFELLHKEMQKENVKNNLSCDVKTPDQISKFIKGENEKL